MGAHFIPPQTALSDGFGPTLHDFADAVDMASLAHAQRRHMRRQAMDAVDHLIALLDALDADSEELEAVDEDGDALDRDEGDLMEDAEDDDPAEETSLETAGRGFVRAGADDAEDDDPAERDDECGSDDGEDIGHHASQFRPVPLTLVERAEVAAIAARAAQVGRPAHA